MPCTHKYTLYEPLSNTLFVHMYTAHTLLYTMLYILYSHAPYPILSLYIYIQVPEQLRPLRPLAPGQSYRILQRGLLQAHWIQETVCVRTQL